jgi:hypothetical protein
MNEGEGANLIDILIDLCEELWNRLLTKVWNWLYLDTCLIVECNCKAAYLVILSCRTSSGYSMVASTFKAAASCFVYAVSFLVEIVATNV